MDLEVAHPQSKQGQGRSGISILVMGKIETIDFTNVLTHKIISF